MNINNFFFLIFFLQVMTFTRIKRQFHVIQVRERETETERCFVVVAAAVDNAKSFNLRHTKD